MFNDDEKVINTEWMKETLKDDRNNNQNRENNQNTQKIDWVLNGKAFKKDLKFKVLPANSHENNIFCHTVATHWIEVDGETKRFICPEQTNHLHHIGATCPICQAKRELLQMGFKEEDLTKPGKFGAIPLFDPKITSNLKVVVISSDLKNDWDQQHVSILQQSGSYLTRWIVQKYTDAETPNLTKWRHSNLIRFSRQSDNSKFEREISFVTFDPTEEVITKLNEENEALTMPDLWKMPSDEEMLKFRQIAGDMKNRLIEARNTVSQAYNAAMQTSIQQPMQQAQPVQQVQAPVQQQSGYQSQQTIPSSNNGPTWNSNPTSYETDSIPF